MLDYLVLTDYKDGGIATKRFDGMNLSGAYLHMEAERTKESVHYVSIFRGDTILYGTRGEYATPIRA